MKILKRFLLITIVLIVGEAHNLVASKWFQLNAKYCCAKKIRKIVNLWQNYVSTIKWFLFDFLLSIFSPVSKVIVLYHELLYRLTRFSIIIGDLLVRIFNSLPKLFIFTNEHCVCVLHFEFVWSRKCVSFFHFP